VLKSICFIVLLLFKPRSPALMQIMAHQVHVFTCEFCVLSSDGARSFLEEKIE